MEWWVVLVIMIGGLMFLMGLGMPVAAAFLTVDVFGLLLIRGPKGLSLISSSIFDSVGSITLGAIPLFYFLGEILFESKSIDIILDAFDKIIGKVRARLNIMAIAVGTILGTLSGSSLADSAVLGSTLLKEMVKRGYDKKLSMGTIMCSGSLAVIIPPSVLAVLTGGLANVSISKLLIAGVLPGLLLASIFVVYVLVRVKLNPALAPVYPVPLTSLREKFLVFLRILPFVFIIFLVMGLILMGVATPTEAAATGALGALLLVALHKRLNLQVLWRSISATMKLTSMLFFIIAGSKAFSQLLAMSGSTRGLLALVTDLDLHPVVMFAIMQFIPFVLGCFVDQISIIMIAIPIYLPLLEALHFNPIWFWLIFLINLTVGAITPPFGLILFVIKGVMPELKISDVFKAALPFVLLILLGMALIAVFPQIALFLPNLFLD